MTTTERLAQVRALIERLAPAPICADCIAVTLDLGSDESADQMVHELAGQPRFERRNDRCAICREDARVVFWRSA